MDEQQSRPARGRLASFSQIDSTSSQCADTGLAVRPEDELSQRDASGRLNDFVTEGRDPASRPDEQIPKPTTFSHQ